MAFDSAGLNAAGGQSKAGNAPQMWTYTTTDAAATVDTSGYFNSIASILSVGDIIFVYDTTTPSLVLTYVNANSGTVVDVADGTTVSATDTD